MPNHKDDPKSGSSSSTGDQPDHEFEGQGQKAAGSRKGAGTPGNTCDDDMTTSGGREGQFSDKNRSSEDQWSPGSTQSSDQ